MAELASKPRSCGARAVTLNHIPHSFPLFPNGYMDPVILRISFKAYNSPPKKNSEH